MPSLAFDQKLPLYFYGNYCLQNSRYYIASYPRSSTPWDVQRTPIARGIGSTVVNKKEQEKELSISAQIVDLSNLDKPDFNSKSQKMIEEFKRILSYENRYLRIMPHDSYVIIDNPSSLAGWTVSDDGVNLALDTEEFSLDNASIRCDSTVSLSGNHSVILTTSSNIGQDLSVLLNSSNNTLHLPQWEIPVYIPDESEILSIDVRIGSSGSNYYTKNIITNYEGKALEQGWNYISIPHSGVSIVGTPDNTTMGRYIWLKFNYSSTTPDLTGFRYGGCLLTQDVQVRNYRCYRSGEIDISDSLNVGAGVATPVSFNLVNYTGYGEGTQTETLFNQTGVTTLSNTQTVTLGGNRDLLPTIGMTLNTVTNLSQLKLSNLNNGQFIFFSNTWTAGDTVQVDNLNKAVTRNGNAQDFTNGRLPIFSLGRNKVRMEVIQSNNSVVSQLLQDISYGYGKEDYVGGTTTALAQAFTTTSSGVLQSIDILTQGNFVGTLFCEVRADNAGVPASTVLASSSISSVSDASFSYKTFNFSLSVTTPTKYWIVLYQRGGLSSFSNGFWGARNSNVYASNDRATNTTFNGGGTGSWTASSGQDHTFNVSIAPTPSTNINWNMSYKRLYN